MKQNAAKPCKQNAADLSCNEKKITKSLDEGTSSDVLRRDCSPCRPVLVAFLLEKASTAPENLSRRSCPTGQDSHIRYN